MVVLQVDSVSSAVGRQVASSLSSPGLEVRVEELTGSLLQGLHVTGLRIAAGDPAEPGSWRLEADTVDLGYDLLPLMTKTVAVKRVEGAGVRFDMRLAASDRREEDRPMAWTIRGERLALRRVRVRIWEPEPEEDQEEARPWVLSRGEARGRDLRIGPGFTVAVDTLTGRFRPKGEEGPWGRLALAGRVGDTAVTLDTLLLESPESRLAAGGTLPFAVENPPPGTLALTFQARPLHLRDLGPLLPAALADSLRLRGGGRIAHDGEAYTLEVDIDAGAGGRLQARSRMDDWEEKGPVQAELHLAGADLHAWGLTDSPLRTHLEVGVEADSAGGTWSGSWSGGARSLTARGKGAFTPGAPALWRVEGEASHDPGVGSEPFPGLEGAAFALGFRWEGEGTSPAELTARGELRVDSARTEAARVVQTRLTGELRARDGALDLRSTLLLPDSGRADLAGSWEPAETGEDRGGRIVVDSLRFASLDPGSFLLPKTAASPPGDPAGLGTLPTAAPTDSTGPPADSTAAPTDSTAAPAAIPAADLNGFLRGSAQLEDGGWTGEATLRLDSSRVGPEAAVRGTVRARADQAGGRAALELEGGLGELQGEVRVVGWGVTSEIIVPGLEFRRMELAPLLAGGGREGLSTELAGRMEGRVTGLEPREAAGRITLVLDSSRVGEWWLSSAELDADLDAGRLTTRLLASAGGGRMELQGEGSLEGETPTYSARGTLHHDSLGVVPGTGEVRGKLHARFGLEGRGLDPDSLEGSAWMAVDSAGWEGVEVDTARLELRASEGSFRLDTLVLASAAGALSGGGILPLTGAGREAGEVHVRGRVRRADMLAGFVNAETLNVGEATFQLTAAGAMDDLELTGEGRVNALLMDGTQLQGMELRLLGRRGASEGFTEATATLTVDRLTTPNVPVRRLDAEASLEEDGEVAVTASAVIDDSREVDLSLRAEDIPRSPAIRLDRFELRADDDRWTLQDPARIRLAEGVEIDSLLLRAGDQAISARGRLAREGPLDLSARVEGFRIGTLSDLLGYPRLQGRVSGSVEFQGTGQEPRVRVQVQSQLEGDDLPSSDLELDAGYAERTLELDGSVRLDGLERLGIHGSLPMAEDGAMNVDATADSLALALLEPFLPPDVLHDTEGSVSGEIRLRGPTDDPALEGSLTASRVDARVPSLGVHFTEGMARLRFEGQRIEVDTFSVRSGDGRLQASGSVHLPNMRNPEYEVSVRSRDFRAINASGVRATVSGDLEISGTGFRPTVSGDVRVRRSDVYLEEFVSAPAVEDVTLTEEEYDELARVFGYRPGSRDSTRPSLFREATLDLALELERDSWLRQRSNPEMAIQFAGQLSVQKEPGDSLRLVGQVSAVPARSYVEQFGRRFSLTEGTLTFQGAPEATRMDLRARYEVPDRDNPDQPEVVITLDIAGTRDDLRLDLGSTPPLEASDMISYLAVGRPADRTLGGGGEEDRSLTGAGGALALGRLSGAVETYAREEVGLDVVEITTEGTEGIILVAGQYLSPELYLGVRQPMNLYRSTGETSERQPVPRFEAELQAVRWLLMNVQTGGRSDVEVFLRSRISYE